MKTPVRIRRLAAVLCLSALASPALAQSFHIQGVITGDASRTVRSTWLDYSDLDLAHTQDARVLLIRIEAAAKAVCHGPHGLDPQDQSKAFRECREEAIARAVSLVRNADLRRLAQERREGLRAAR